MISTDDILKIVQIIFYTVTMLVAVFTYLSAKKGLLNTVNTEYQKRVILRLEQLSDELASEYYPDSSKYWANGNYLKEIIDSINKEFINHKEEILKTGKFYYPIPLNSYWKQLNAFEKRIKSDPFIPETIRNKTIELVKNRSETYLSVYINQLENYINELAAEKNIDDLDSNFKIVQNHINNDLYKMGCGVSQIEEEIDSIRIYIQKYFNKFNPAKKI